MLALSCSAHLAYSPLAQVALASALLAAHCLAAASLSVPLTASFDAVRMLTFAAMAAVADAVLRMVPSDEPEPERLTLTLTLTLALPLTLTLTLPLHAIP